MAKRQDYQRIRKSADRIAAERRQRERKIIAWGIVVVLLMISAVVAYGLRTPGGDLEGFARCLTEAGATMYGTDTCSFCQAQKRLFGKSFKYVDYANCNYGTRCQEAGITGYPTWVMPDGERLTGLQEIDVLAERSGCALP